MTIGQTTMNKVFQLLGKPLGKKLTDTGRTSHVVTAQEETYITNGKSAIRFPVGIECIPSACGPIDPPREDGSHSLQNERNVYKSIGSGVDVPLENFGGGISLDNFRNIFHKTETDVVSVNVDLKRLKDIVDALVPFTSGEYNTATLEVGRKDPISQIRINLIQQDGKTIDTILMALVDQS